METKKM